MQSEEKRERKITMKRIEIGKGKINASEIGLGCMRITGLSSVKEVRSLIDTAMDCGIDFFDHADIYAGGEAEQIFGQAIDTGIREKMILQTNVPSVPGSAMIFQKTYPGICG